MAANEQSNTTSLANTSRTLTVHSGPRGSSRRLEAAMVLVLPSLLVCVFLFFFCHNKVLSYRYDRKCCPPGFRYNEELIFCRETNSTDDSFIDYGLPECEEDTRLRFVPKVFPESAEDCVEGNFTLTCVKDPPRLPVLRKCCPLGEVFMGSNCTALLPGIPFTVTFFEPSTMLVASETSFTDFELVFGLSFAKHGLYILSPPETSYNHSEQFVGEKVFVLVNGSVYIPNLGTETFSSDQCCLEVVEDIVYTFMAFPGDEPLEDTLEFKLLAVAFLVSSLCLLATLLIYLSWPKTQNLYGKTLMCYVSSLLVAYTVLAIVQLSSHHLSDVLCALFGYVVLFSFLAAFSWLNVMGVDIWKTLRSIRVKDASFSKRRTFIRYSLYAWGVPCIITGLAILMEFTDLSLPSLKPHIGTSHCWFPKDSTAKYVYYVGPVAVVILCNVVLYVLTARRCFQVKAEINKMQGNKGDGCQKRFATNKEQFVLNLKLFIVMGVTWSMDIASYLVPSKVWYLFDAINALHGLLIFIIFGMKKEVYERVSQSMRAPLRRMGKSSRSESCEMATTTSCGERARKYSSMNTTTSVLSDSSK